MKSIRTMLFWVLSLIWGFPMTVFGLLVFLVLRIAGYKPKRFGSLFYFEVGELWGGFECGPIFVVNKNASDYLKRHEAGHGIQNIILGPLMPVLVSIPSMIRYWYRSLLSKVNKNMYMRLPPYDSVWFEKSATDLGTKYFFKRVRASNKTDENNG